MNGTELAQVKRIPDGELATLDFTRDKVELLKRTVCAGATDDELELFMHACRRTGLDPFMKQIHAVKRWDGNARREVMAIQTGIDGYRLIADRTDRYMPGREPSYEYDPSGNLIAATAYVKKLARDGTWHEVSATAHFTEYVGTTKDGIPNRMWREKPHIMLAKCAESQALRRAFPAEMSGVYTAEEMDKADSPPARPAAKRDEFVDTFIAAVAGRGFDEERAHAFLGHFLESKNLTLAKLDLPARTKLLSMVNSGQYDAWLRPPAKDQGRADSHAAPTESAPGASAAADEPAPPSADPEPVDVVNEALDRDARDYRATLVDALKAAGTGDVMAGRAIDGWFKLLGGPKADGNTIPLEKRRELYDAIKAGRVKVSNTGVMRYEPA